MRNQNNCHALPIMTIMHHLVYSYSTLILVLTCCCSTSLLLCNASVIFPNYDIEHIDGTAGGDHHQLIEPIMIAPASGAGAAATAALFTDGGHPAQRTSIKSAQDIMVDITNRFAFSVMRVHTEKGFADAAVFGRRGGDVKHDNFVFSPCGLSSVLIALYEGATGQSAYEIYRAMRLPWDRDVVRVGIRDIHRRLRVSFRVDTTIDLWVYFE